MSEQHIPNMGYVDSSDGATPAGETQSARPGIVSSGHTSSIPDLSSQHEVQTVFATATSHSSLDGTGADAPRYGAVHPLMRQPPSGQEPGFLSPSPYRDGRPLESSQSPLRTGSAQRGSTQQVDPTATPPPSGETTGITERVRWPTDDHARSRMPPEVSPPPLSTESSITPIVSIPFDVLEGVISQEQIMGLRTMVSNHGLQRQKLVTAGSYLRGLREETLNLRTNAESLTGRVDRVLSDTVQLVLDGDNVLYSLSRAFGGSTGPQIDPTPRVPSVTLHDNHRGEDERRESETTGSDFPDPRAHQEDQPQVENARSDPSTRLHGAMDRELPPRRPDESEDQYFNRYQAHLHRIDNTLKSWARDGYDVPPHLTGQETREQPLGQEPEAKEGVTPTEKTPRPHPRPPAIPRLHPNDPAQIAYRARMAAEATRGGVHFESVSRPNKSSLERDYEEEDMTEYHGGPEGLSAFRVSHTAPSHGIWNTEHYHYSVLIKHIKKLIQWKVGLSLIAPPGSKQPKISEPHKYAGNKNHDVFLQWLNQFLNWLRNHYYCGDEADFSRLNLLGNYVEGSAADWYAADVDNPDRIDLEPMKFTDAICAMHRRFVRTATANNAVTQYDKVEYSASDGVEGFYYRLDKLANRMIERPSDYSFRLRIFDGLPAWIYDTLLERNILPEFCNLDDIRENARQIEEMRLRSRGTPKGSAVTTERNRAPQRPTTNRTSRPAPSNTAQARPQSSANPRPNNFNRSGERSSSRPRFASTNDRGPNRPDNNNSNVKPSGQQNSHATRGTTNQSGVVCYSCGMIGHIATSPECKNYQSRQNRPRINAQRLLDGEEGENAVEDGHREEDHPEAAESEHSNSWGGSQYDPEDEYDEVVLEDTEEPQDPPEEEDPEVRMSTMRAVRMHMMRRITEPSELLNINTMAEPVIGDIEELPACTLDQSASSASNPQQRADSSSNEEGPSAPPTMGEGEGTSARPYSVHDGLFEDGGEEISDPVFIEYRDGLIYRLDHTEDFEHINELLRRAVCWLCRRCNPRVRQEHFTGQDGSEYWYNVFICCTPVERSRAEEEISDDESDFDVRRFFAARTILSTQDESDQESDDSMPALVDIEIERDAPAAGYIDDPELIGMANIQIPTSGNVDMIVNIPEGGFQCSECRECTPRVVAVYRDDFSGTRFHRFRTVCTRHALIENQPVPNGIRQHSDGSDNGSSDNEPLPELESISEEEREDPRSRTYESEVSVVSNGLSGLGLEANNTLRTMPSMIRRIMAEALISPNAHPSFEEYDLEDQEIVDVEDANHPEHRHEPIECPYCHECEPSVEQVFYGGSDGDVFSRDRIICRAPGPSVNGQLRAMRTVHSSTVRRKTPSGSEQPKRSGRLQATLAAEVEINGIKALALFDSGSTTDSVTPEFAFASKATQFKLEEQVILQLGCVGSRSKISYGTQVPINVCDIKDKVYFDLVNIDRYDCIIGTPFMNTYGVCLDFGSRTIRMNGHEIKAFSFAEEQSYVDKKQKSRGRRSLPRETAPIRARKIVTSLPPAPSN
jgi:hypothetical protein